MADRQQQYRSNTEARPSTTRTKLEQLKQLVIDAEPTSNKPLTVQINSCQHGKCCSNGCSTNKLLQAPIILERRTPKTAKHTSKTKFDFQITAMGSPRGTTFQAKAVRRQVEEFTPIEIPTKKSAVYSSEYLTVQQPRTKQIEVRIEKDEKDKDCIKKLFKKISKLTDELNASERERGRLQLELDNYRDLENRQRQYERRIRELQLDKHKLDLQLATLREQLANEKLKPPQIVEKIVERPVEVIRQVPVQKIVEVQVEVAKLIPGPERIIEKFVEVPKYVEVQRKVPMEVIKEVVREVPKEVVRTIQVPEYLEKPVYIDKPVYVDRVVERKVEVPIEVPIETPVYIDRPHPVGQPVRINDDYEYRSKLDRLGSVEGELKALSQDNQYLKNENRELLRSLQVLKKHNQDKNREVEQLIQSTHDHTMLQKGALGGYAFRAGTHQQQAWRHQEQIRFRS